MQLGGAYFFNLVKEGDSMYFATDDENERNLWVQAIYRATGQTHKPTPPVIHPSASATTDSAAPSSNIISTADSSRKGAKGGMRVFNPPVS